MEIFFSSKAKRQFKRLPSQVQLLITKHVMKLSKNPLPLSSKKLAGKHGWRIRIGDHRVLYTFNKKELTILSLSHRRDAYRLFLF